jgi:membrane fusion protein, adhesin transport system
MRATHDLDALAREIKGRSDLQASLLLGAIVALIVAAIVWAAVTEIDDVTRGDGRIVPSQNVQMLQAAEPGVLSALHVAEGDVVQAGDLVMELDGTLMTSQLDQEVQRTIALRAQIARLEAELSDAQTIEIPSDLAQLAGPIIANEQALFDARRAQFQAEMNVLERQRVQRAQEYEEGKIAQLLAEQTLALIQQEIGMIAPLVANGVEPEMTLLSLRRNEAELQGRATSSVAALLRLQAALAEIDDRAAALRATKDADARTEMAAAAAELAQLQSRLPALQQRVNRNELRAPVRGVVNRIMLTTIGGVAQAGDTLVEIVPIDDTLLVEAYLRPADIAFLSPGQPVKVRLTAYDSARYGSLDGEILRIGADAVQRPDRDEQAFVVQVRTFSNILDADGEVVEIVPGMVAEVDILSGKKTVMDYIIRPIVRVRERALRE